MKNTLRLKIPPVILALLALIGQLLTVDFHFVSFSPNVWQWLCALILLIAAIVLSSWSIMLMKTARNSLNPHCPENTGRLITAGIFAYTRNPMYLSLVLGLLATTILLGSLWGLVWVVVFIGLITELQIKPEEQILQKHFSEYAAYRRRVRRWF